MTSRRRIPTSLFHNPAFGTMSFPARLHYIELLFLADDQGRGEAPEWNGIEEVLVSDLVVSYEANGGRLFQIKDWWKTQAPGYARPSRYAGPKNWTDHENYMDGRTRVMVNWKIRNPYDHAAYRRLKEAVFERDNYTCQYCGAPAEHLEHIIPRSRNGEDTMENCVAACVECNLIKGARTPEEAGMELRGHDEG